MLSKRIFSTSLSAIFVLLSLPMALCHVIGGGVNTNFGVQDSENLLSDLLDIRLIDLISWERVQEVQKSIWKYDHQYKKGHSSKVRHSKNRGVKKHLAHKKFPNEEENSLNEERHRVHGHNKKDKFRPLNEMLREKREVQCTFPRYILSQKVQDINSHINVPVVFRFTTEDNKQLPTGQFVMCINNDTISGSSWDKCLSVATERDLGANFFPRFIRDVHCIDVTSNRCHNLTNSVTVYRKESCTKGGAVLRTVKMSFNAGCACNADN